MNAAQRAAKRFRRELRKGQPPAAPAPDRVLEARFHRFYLPTRERADEMGDGFMARGRFVTIKQQDGALPWQLLLRANAPEMRDPGLYVHHYQTFAAQFGGEYAGYL